MDEADLLSDKIVILAKGQVVASGSSSFLKKRFGTGFLLTITLVTNVPYVEDNVKVILDTIRSYIPEAILEGSPAIQFVVNLPYESKIKFSQLFAMLEDRSSELNIDSFGLSVNTLEQVFIK
jgi:ABC-type multidrug transport system ATPase subunit